MKYIFILVFIITQHFANESWDKKVHIFGNLTEVVRYQGSGDTISLQNLKNKTSIYGVGLLDKLQGEIQIFDSKPYISSINQNGTVTLDESLNHQASFLLYADVPEWISIKVPDTIYNKQQFIEYLEDIAKENGISIFSPFPFLLEGKIKANKYRILTYQNNEMIKGYGGTCACDLTENRNNKKSLHKSISLYDTLLATPVKLLGFYSPKRGIITDKYSYLYMNFITENKNLAGHAQKIMLGEKMILKLPKID